MQVTESTPKVVIIGAGFAGLYAARALAGARVQITLVDRRNHHTFQPLLYQVATATLSPSAIAYPIRHVFRENPNISVLLARATGFDLENRLVRLDNDTLGYDYLLVAAGATHAYFGHPEWAKFAPGLKTVEDSTEIRRRVLLAFEIAERRARLRRKREPINFFVVGGGPTGVELAGALAEISRHVLASDFTTIDPRNARVVLVEAGPRILPAFNEKMSASAARQLKKLGVEVMTGKAVTNIDEEHVYFADGEMPASVVLWGAGVAASPLGKMLGAPTDRAGRVLVEPDLSLPGRPEVMVLGDLSAVKRGDGRPVPGVAPAAIQMGEYAAEAIQQKMRGEQPKPFHYRDKGSLATIGRSSAVAEFAGVRLSGTPAWLAWLFVHILFLIGFSNRVQVIWNWFWSYLTFQRGARLITGTSRSIVPKPPDSVLSPAQPNPNQPGGPTAV
ncbi:MAG: NAD(P)/FAD-dependent oxidoreductase [Acidobacteriota bacterium]|nr:NAD(P)/FAD-dependent oxidoreductase [Acidobacteriota bacterium]